MLLLGISLPLIRTGIPRKGIPHFRYKPIQRVSEQDRSLETGRTQVIPSWQGWSFRPKYQETFSRCRFRAVLASTLPRSRGWLERRRGEAHGLIGNTSPLTTLPESSAFAKGGFHPWKRSTSSCNLGSSLSGFTVATSRGSSGLASGTGTANSAFCLASTSPTSSAFSSDYGGLFSNSAAAGVSPQEPGGQSAFISKVHSSAAESLYPRVGMAHPYESWYKSGFHSTLSAGEVANGAASSWWDVHTNPGSWLEVQNPAGGLQSSLHSGAPQASLHSQLGTYNPDFSSLTHSAFSSTGLGSTAASHLLSTSQHLLTQEGFKPVLPSYTDSSAAVAAASAMITGHRPREALRNFSGLTHPEKVPAPRCPRVSDLRPGRGGRPPRCRRGAGSRALPGSRGRGATQRQAAGVTCSGRGKINSELARRAAGHGSPPRRLLSGFRRNAFALGVGQKSALFPIYNKTHQRKPSRSSFCQARVTILSSMIKDLFALPLPLRVRKRPSSTDSPEMKKGAALGRRAGSFNQENRKHVTFLKINDTILSYMLVIIIWSGELLHKEKLKNRQCENRKINLISLFEFVVKYHLFSGKMLTREPKALGNRAMSLQTCQL
uniref:Sp9 transcription factor n=1 Tax=Apteryx owenii TaxID=8824 RepID=A0A8B9QWU1_APTOW